MDPKDPASGYWKFFDCPYCEAKGGPLGGPCVTPSGKETDVHKDRLQAAVDYADSL